MKARKMLEDVYKIVYENDPDTYKSEMDNLNNLSDAELKKKILDDDIYIYAKPFKEVSLEGIKKFADYLKIDLDEKVVLGNGVVPERPVPVGLNIAQLKAI